MEQKATRLPNVALTYANDVLIDGAGSQLQKIYSIYALSRFLNVSYFHSPIKSVGYYGLSAVENNAATPEIIARYNQVFAITSDIEVPSVNTTHYHPIAELGYLCGVRDAAKNNSEFHLVKIASPSPLVDAHSQLLHCIKAISPFEALPSPLFRIAIHVRRGDLFISYLDRMLPNSYYISLALQSIEVLTKLGIPFVCELYTEVPSKTFVVTPEHHSVGNRITKPVTIAPEDSFIEEFDVLPNLQKFISTDPIESLISLATADLLVMSLSSFSYLPAILNKKGCVVYHYFWHAPLPDWLDYSNQELFTKNFREYCEQWKYSGLKRQSRNS